MTIIKAFESGRQHRNISHFAAIARMAAVDGSVNEHEKELLLRFAYKLDIDEADFKEIIKNPDNYPLDPILSREERLECLHDLFRMIFIDHTIDKEEERLINKYAIGLGCSPHRAKEVVRKSIKLFGGDIDFEDYRYLMNSSL